MAFFKEHRDQEITHLYQQLPCIASSSKKQCSIGNCEGFKDASSRIKQHINIKYHHICEHIKDGLVKVLPIDTHYQVADIFTKPLEVENYSTSLGRSGPRRMTT